MANLFAAKLSLKKASAFFVSFLTLLTLALGAVGVLPAPKAEAAVMIGHTYYVDPTAHHWVLFDGNNANAYDYDASWAPPSYGTASKPFTDMSSAVDAASYNGDSIVNIKYCDGDATSWGSGGAARSDWLSPKTPKDIVVVVLPWTGPGCASSHQNKIGEYFSEFVIEESSITTLEINGFTFESKFKNNGAQHLHLNNNTFKKDVDASSTNESSYIKNNVFDGKLGSRLSLKVGRTADAGATLSVSSNTFNYTDLKGSANSFKSNVFNESSLDASSSSLEMEEVSSNTFNISSGTSVASFGLQLPRTKVFSNNIVNGPKNGFLTGGFEKVESNQFSGIPANCNLSATVTSCAIVNASMDVFSKNTFSLATTTPKSALVAVETSGGTQFNGNDFKGLSKAYQIKPGGTVTGIYDDKFENVTYPIWNDGSIGTVSNISVSNAVNGVRSTAGAYIGTLSQSNFSNVKVGVEMGAGNSVGLISNNAFTNFSQGIAVEDENGAYEYLAYGAAVKPEDTVSSGSSSTSKLNAKITYNVFKNEASAIKKSVVLGTADLYGSGSFSSFSTIDNNTYENVGRFADFRAQGSVDAISYNRNLTTGVASSQPALEFAESSRVFVSDNDFGNQFHSIGLFSHGASVSVADQVFNSISADVRVGSSAKTSLYGFNLKNVELLSPVIGMQVDTAPGNLQITIETVHFSKNSLGLVHLGGTAVNLDVRVTDSFFDANTNGVSFDGVGKLNLSNNTFTSATGVMVSKSGEAQISGNDFQTSLVAVKATDAALKAFSGNTVASGPKGLELIRGTSADFSMIGNVFQSIDEPVVLDSSKVNVIAYNSIFGSVVAAIQLRSAELVADEGFTNNLISGTPLGVSMDTFTVLTSPHQIYVFDSNTFDDNGEDIHIATDLGGGADVYLVNNVFANGSGGASRVSFSLTNPFLYNNLFQVNNPADILLEMFFATYTWDDLKEVAVSCDGVSCDVAANKYDSTSPFEDAGAGDYRLRLNSYGMNSAKIGYSSTDMIGTARPSGSGADIGAYERVLTTVDADGDGLTAEEEAAWGTYDDPAYTAPLGTELGAADFDGDGVSDADEVYKTNTDPAVSDVDPAADDDGDGILNGDDACRTEASTGYDVDVDGCLDDTDGDGLNDKEETEDTLTDPLLDDTDGDTLTDYEEVITYNTDPLLKDTDNDSMTDDQEVSYVCLNASTDDGALDFDADDFTNYEEVSYGSSPCTNDTDGDTVLDGYELKYQFGLSGVGTAYGTACIDVNFSDKTNDLDVDGLDNATEYAVLGAYGYEMNPCSSDTDSDTLPDAWEYLYLTPTSGSATGLDPTVSDASSDNDSDSASNKIEYYYSTDPTDATSKPSVVDLDLDGLDDVWESGYSCVLSGTADGSADPDSDTLTNLQEYGYGTDPCSNDTDGDGLTDNWEVTYTCVSATVSDASLDADSDGLTATQEKAYGTSPCSSDTDSDGLDDKWEAVTYVCMDPALSDASTDYDSDTLTATQEKAYGTSPCSSDTDSDTMTDAWEAVTYVCMDPALSDASTDYDSDTLTNLAEYGYGTNPCSSDTDSDGMGDKWEVSYACVSAVLSDASADSDADGLVNSVEYAVLGAYGYEMNPCSSDTDSDTLPDAWEYLYLTPTSGSATGLNPSLNDASSDNDSDSASNKIEYYYSTDPTDATSKPSIVDLDGDLMDDAWESGYSCVLSGTADGSADPDSDTLTNLQEYGYGTNPCTTDTDSDGLTDNWEVTYACVSATVSDASLDVDSDGLTATQEKAYGTSPCTNDTDGDAMDDKWEAVTYVCMDPALSDASTDYDSDALTNLQEYGYGTSPCSNDTDSDAMDDKWEAVTYVCMDPSVADASTDYDSDTLTNLQEYGYGTNPCDDDTDSDTMTDAWELSYACLSVTVSDGSTDDDSDSVTAAIEFVHSTDPCDDDTDDDTLPDGWEITYISVMDPTVQDATADPDGDGYNNLNEYRYSTDPSDATSHPSVPDSDGDGYDDTVDAFPTDADEWADADSDTLGDNWETTYSACGLSTSTADSTTADSDSDTLTTGDEFTARTSPCDNDTDSDGFRDDYELTSSTDPLDSGDSPTLELSLIGYENVVGHGTAAGGDGSSLWVRSGGSYASTLLGEAVLSELYYMEVYFSQDGLLGLKYDADQFLGTVTVQRCGVSVASSTPPAAGTVCGSTPSVVAPSSLPSSVKAFHSDYADFTWFDSPSVSSTRYLLYSIQLIP